MNTLVTNRLVDAHGHPLVPLKEVPRDGAKLKMLTEAVNSYLQSLGQTQAPAELRSRDPFSNHVWVYASAMVTAISAASAPFVVMRETSSTVSARATLAAKAGRLFTPRAGAQRRSLERHIQKSVGHRILSKAAEPDYEHPSYAILRSPNPFQSSGALFQFTYLWLSLRGEVFWIYTDDNGQITQRDKATQIWPFGPDYFKPALSNGSRGTLIGWWFTPPAASPIASTANRIPIHFDEISQFKFANPMSHFRGMSRLTAAAMSIETSLMAKAYNRSLLRNSGVPKGVITYPVGMGDTEQNEFIEKWEQRHAGEQNAGQTAMLTGGFQYQQVGLALDDIQYIQGDDIHKREVLAAMGTPPSVVGVTETLSYATGQAQENGFWMRTILPMHYIVESELDATLFYTETDDVFGMHDISNIDALRAGIGEKIEIANKMCTPGLHMPPRTAFSIVGLDVPEYEGDDVAFVSGIVSTVKETLADPSPDAVPNVIEGEKYGSLQSHTKVRVTKARARQKEFFRLVKKMEPGFKKGYRSWVKSELARTLARFDKQTKELELKANVNVEAILPIQSGSSASLRGKTSKPMRKTMRAAFDFSAEDLGSVPVFDITQPRFDKYYERRAEAFSEDVSKTVIRKLRKALQDGLSEGETVQELRMRVAHVYQIAQGSAKALMVARTETSNMINGIRTEVFKEHGVTRIEWVDSGDDIVRESHRAFGSSGTHEMDFNYMSLIGEEGTLRHPGDLDGPAGEVINCRCTTIPIE